jgi:hypothetical protein
MVARNKIIPGAWDYIVAHVDAVVVALDDNGRLVAQELLAGDLELEMARILEQMHMG